MPNVNQHLLADKKPFGPGGHSSVHYQNHTLYQIHHHHYHHMLMAEDYLKDTPEHHHYQRNKELNVVGPVKELDDNNYDYPPLNTGGASISNVTSIVDPNISKYSQSSLIMGSLLPINTSGSMGHLEEDVEYPKHSRELWVHEGA